MYIRGDALMCTLWLSERCCSCCCFIEMGVAWFGKKVEGGRGQEVAICFFEARCCLDFVKADGVFHGL